MGVDKAVVQSITTTYDKLLSKGYMSFVKDLSKEEQVMLSQSELRHYLCWDIVFNPKSLSTPARPVMDASSNTPGGTNLNDVCVKGTPQIVNLLSLILGWVVGQVAIAGDASSFYNCIKLDTSHWTYQRLLLHKDLDPAQDLQEAVIKTLIYGVVCVSAQSEEVLKRLADKVRPEFPEVAEFLEDHRYVDDMGSGVVNDEQAQALIDGVTAALDCIKLKIKAWVVSGKAPPDQVTDAVLVLLISDPKI